MSGSTDAQRVFDAGVLSLGIPIDGLETERDLQYAALAFRRATEYDPDMCDAWLGRAATGDTSPEVIYHLYRTSTLSLFREQRRLGLPQRALSGRFQTGLYLDYPLSTKTEMWLAYAASMIQRQGFRRGRAGARQSWNRPRRTQDGDTGEICAYIRGVLHFTTQRWPDVLSALSRSGSFTDSYIGAGADLMVGSACAQMGLFGEGIRRLDRRDRGPRSRSTAGSGVLQGADPARDGRGAGRPGDLRTDLQRGPGFEANAAALADPKYRLVITSKEIIDSRSDRWDPASVPSAEDLMADDLSERGNEYLQGRAGGTGPADRPVGGQTSSRQTEVGGDAGKGSRGQGAQLGGAQPAPGVHRPARNRQDHDRPGGRPDLLRARAAADTQHRGGQAARLRRPASR